MIKPALFGDSASGIRPASAFVMIGLVLSVIGVWVARLAFRTKAPPAVHVEQDPSPEYTIADAQGRPLALFVQRLDLVVSPNALWQAHTPSLLIDSVARALGGRIPRDELARRLIPDAERGIVRCAEPLSEAQASALDRWILTGALGAEPARGRIEGMWVERGAKSWILAWRPEVALSPEMRTRFVPRDDKNPLRWSRRIADGIARCLWGDQALADGDDERALDGQRARVWSILMPTRYAVAVRRLDAEHAPALFQLLSDEGVLHVQMHIARDRDRCYPFGTLRLFGGWGFLDRAAAQARALSQMGLAPETAGALNAPGALEPALARELRERSDVLLATRIPVSGLELAGARTIQQPEWAFLESRPASYTYERHTPARRREPRVEPRPYYVDSQAAGEAPELVTTLDAYLQREVGRQLDILMERNQPALAEAIVVDVATGDVLAVDSREAYPFAAFAPIRHGYTPGSTMKVIVMAAALDQGVVDPDDVFDVGDGRAYPLPHRIIHEAENPTKFGRVTAAEILAYSINAGMVQIGPRVEDRVLAGYFAGLGYGRAPQTGLGPELAGAYPRLPWKPVWEHASVSFGHEMTVTLWQHAAALATVIRGGEFLPLRLVDAIVHDGLRYDMPPAVPRRVFGPDACAKVRAMMELGASAGTGKPVAGRDVLPEIELVGTKTGTAQKVPSEICLHAELAHQERHHRDGTRCTKACRAKLRGQRRPHRECYTSSMCAFGRDPSTGREVMVYVVADEPRTGKYGSKVAGPTAIAILKEALGFTELGEVAVADVVPGFAPSELPSLHTPDAPVAEVGR